MRCCYILRVGVGAWVFARATPAAGATAATAYSNCSISHIRATGCCPIDIQLLMLSMLIFWGPASGFWLLWLKLHLLWFIVDFTVQHGSADTVIRVMSVKCRKCL